MVIPSDLFFTICLLLKGLTQNIHKYKDNFAGIKFGMEMFEFYGLPFWFPNPVGKIVWEYFFFNNQFVFNVVPSLLCF